MTESALARPFFLPSSQGGGSGGGTQWAGGIAGGGGSTLLVLRRFQDDQRGLQDGAKTRLRQSKTDPRRPTAPPRLSRWLQGASQTAQDGPKIDKNQWKIDVKSHPHIGFIFCSIFD